MITHARGREAVLTSARAGVDVIFHAFEMDEEGLDAVLESGSVLSPALTFVANTAEFTRPTDPCFKWRPGQNRRVVDDAREMLVKAREQGVPFMVGTDSGFAITPYGEWHAKELELMVDDLGFTPGEALKATTSGNSGLLRERDDVGRLAEGAYADITVVAGNPLDDIAPPAEAGGDQGRLSRRRAGRPRARAACFRLPVGIFLPAVERHLHP